MEVSVLSIINDVYQCVRFADRIGQSKKEFRKNDEKYFIYSQKGESGDYWKGVC